MSVSGSPSPSATSGTMPISTNSANPSANARVVSNAVANALRLRLVRFSVSMATSNRGSANSACFRPLPYRRPRRIANAYNESFPMPEKHGDAEAAVEPLTCRCFLVLTQGADMKKVRQALIGLGPLFLPLVLPYHYMSNIVMDKNMPESALLMSRVDADALSTRRFCN